MRYIPNTDKDCQEMLREVNISSTEEMLSQIPSEVRLKEKLSLPEPLCEADLLSHLTKLGEKNINVGQYVSYLGAGAYNHFIPAIVGHLLSRSEFYTSYTPYQPEISQGTLQAIFEFQTLLCQLMNMDVANASMYDGATALAEAIHMAKRINKRSDVLIAQTVHPEHRETVLTYFKNTDTAIENIPFDNKSGRIDLSSLKNSITDKTSAVVVGYPNFFGTIEDLSAIEEVVKNRGALFIISVLEPVCLGLLKPPGDFNADVVVAEGQSFGNPLGFGGPQLGIFATNKKFIRYMPGRLVGRTKDREGRDGFVLTLSTREQHIRRDKATSNICSNQSLCALSAAIYMSAMGKAGMRKLAGLNLSKANYAKKLISLIPGFSVVFSGPTFNEFVIRTPCDVSELNNALLKCGIIGGFGLKRFFPDLANCMLFCVTEVITKNKIHKLCEVLKAYGKK